MVGLDSAELVELGLDGGDLLLIVSGFGLLELFGEAANDGENDQRRSLRWRISGLAYLWKVTMVF